MNRGDIFAYKGVARAGYVAIVSNDGFNAITGHPVVVKVSDRPDLTETPYVVALSQNDPVPGTWSPTRRCGCAAAGCPVTGSASSPRRPCASWTTPWR